jgi:hypothetical protein
MPAKIINKCFLKKKLPAQSGQWGHGMPAPDELRVTLTNFGHPPFSIILIILIA